MELNVRIDVSLGKGESLSDAVAALLGAEGARGQVLELCAEPPREEPPREGPASAPEEPGREAAKGAPEAAPEAAPAGDAGDGTPPAAIEDVRRAARKAMNSGKRAEVEAAIGARSADGRLTGVPEGELASLLAEIEAL